ncbi:hypothetical protein ZWY2020_014963 [Hordeum vulgare]|nr:hypothetical protein ZWY2020_014963 [Hordeum vulgare]
MDVHWRSSSMQQWLNKTSVFSRYTGSRLVREPHSPADGHSLSSCGARAGDRGRGSAETPAPTGLAGCATSCGDVSVPYLWLRPAALPLAGAQPHLRHRRPAAPQLLLGDNAPGRRHLPSGTPRSAWCAGSIVDSAGVTSDRNVSFGGGFVGAGYMLSNGNELVLSGCNLLATLVEDLGVGPGRSGIISGCASFCSFRNKKVDSVGQPAGKYCSGMACCQAPINYQLARVHLRWLDARNHSEALTFLPTYVFVAEEGWFDRRPLADELLSVRRSPSEAALEVPLVLLWAVKQGLPPLPSLTANSSTACSDDTHRMLCKSGHSVCAAETSATRANVEMATTTLPHPWVPRLVTPTLLYTCNISARQP